MDIDSLTVSTYDYNSLTLLWELIPADGESLSDYTISIYKSETPEPITDFNIVASGIEATTITYTDVSISGYMSRQFHNWWYYIDVINITNPETHVLSDTERFAFAQDPQAKVILRDKLAGLKKYGKQVYIKKRKHFTETCTACWDSVLGKVTDDDCPLCHGTGKIGGYYDSILTWASMNEAPNRNQITPFGIWQDNDTLLNLLNYPPVNPGDLIIDQLNRRWVIEQINPARKEMILIGQNCRASLRDRSDPVYEVDL